MATHDDIGKTNPTFHTNENELSSTKQTQTNRNRSSPIKATYAEPNVCAACLVDVKHLLSCISPPSLRLSKFITTTIIHRGYWPGFSYINPF